MAVKKKKKVKKEVKQHLKKKIKKQIKKHNNKIPEGWKIACEIIHPPGDPRNDGVAQLNFFRGLYSNFDYQKFEVSEEITYIIKREK